MGRLAASKGVIVRRRPWFAAGTAALLVAALALPTAPARAEDYPSWEEVVAAKQNVATREAEATRITDLVAELETESARLGDAAVEAAGASAAASAAHAGAEQRASTLGAASDAAAAEAVASGERLGRVGAVLARSGGADVTLRLLLSDESSDLLQGLSRAAQLTHLYGGIAEHAEAANAQAEALAMQADVAERERERLAVEAADAAAAAEDAHQAAEAEVVEQRAVVDTLYAQLASLRDSTAELERQHQAGEQIRLAEEARQQAAEEASGSIGSAPPPGVVVDTAGAKAYAAAAVARYGWGNGEYQCLVRLWTRESSWRADAYNASSGAYGIPQSLPGSKMASAGADWRTNAATQIEWGLSYIADRYGAPCGAWAHSEDVNWY